MMRKAFFIVLILGLSFGSLQFASQYFRYELFDLAIKFEQGKANLLPQERLINGQHYYYLSRDILSAKDTVVLLHGFSANKENWLRFAQHLPGNIQVYALDLLGHGAHSIDLLKDYNIESQVEYLHQFIKHSINQPVHIVGNSMGGAIASLYAAKYPDDIKTLMLISPAGVHDVPSEMDKLIEQGNNPLIANSVDQFFDVVDFVMEDQPIIPGPILEVQAERAVKRYALNQKIFSDLRNDLQKKLDQHFSDIKCPSMIIWGKEDRVINAKNIQRYASLISNSQSMVLDGVGHLAMLEKPDLMAQMFITLVSENSVYNPATP